jgi:hypothetical protein
MTRLQKLVGALVALLLIFAACAGSASAIKAGSGSTGPGTTTSTPGGGSGKVTYNDVKNVNRQGFTFTKAAYNDFFKRAGVAGNGVQKTKMLQLGLGATYKSEKKSGTGYRGKLQSGKLALNTDAFGEIGLLNRCPLGKSLLNNEMAQKISGCWFTGNGSDWNNIHPDAPNGGSTATQGGTQFIAMRLWRSCEPVKTAKGVMLGYKVNSVTRSSCKETPILERIPPGSDSSSASNAHYLQVTRNGNGDAVTTSSSGYLSTTTTTRTVAGMLYGRHATSGGGTWNGTKPVKASLFQKVCRDGVLGGSTSDDWSKQEMLSELKYRVDKLGDDWFTEHQAGIRKWITEDGKGWPFAKGGKRMSGGGSGDKLCRAFSEYLNLSWSIGRRTKKGGGAAVNWSGNLIPGRVYLADYAYLDARESIVAQQLEFMSSAADYTPEDPIFPPMTSTQAYGHVDYVLPKAGFVGTVSTASLAASSAQPSEVDRATLLGGVVCNAEVDADKLPALCPKEVETEWGETRFADPINYSLWTPRAAAFAIYNPRDAAEDSYRATHDLKTNFAAQQSPSEGLDRSSGADTLFAPFIVGNTAFNDYGPAISGKGKPMFGQEMPLLSNEDGSLAAGATVVNDRTTETPASENGVVGAVQMVDASETRAMSVIAENRWQNARWTMGKTSLTEQRWMRLTMDDCSTDGPFGIKNMLVPTLAGTPDCDAAAPIAGSGWKVRDAYRVPGVKAGSPATRYLDVLFSQERTGNAKLTLAVHGSEAQAIYDNVSSIQVFNAASYRDGASEPDYSLEIFEGKNSMVFCEDCRDPWGIAAPTSLETGEEAIELPAGEYVARFVIDGNAGYPDFTWGAIAELWTNTEQRWVSRFEVQAAAETAPIYRARTAG